MAEKIIGPVDDGTSNGDILRWNSISGKWEPISEPLIFDEINLKPKASSSGAEGTIFYCNDNNVYVGVE